MHGQRDVCLTSEREYLPGGYCDDGACREVPGGVGQRGVHLGPHWRFHLRVQHIQVLELDRRGGTAQDVNLLLDCYSLVH